MAAKDDATHGGFTLPSPSCPGSTTAPRDVDYDFDPGSNVVDVYIRYLRRKLGADVIETVRGMGYRLRADSPEVDPEPGDG